VIDSTIIIHFDDSEHLTVSNPESVFYASNGDLFMKNALRVRITWCSEKDPDKDCEEMFGKFGRLIYVNRKDDLYSTGTGFLGQLDTHLRICP
jgi:hypothetical protein